MRRFLLLSSAFVLFATGCIEVAEPAGTYEFVGQPIIGGDSPDDDRYDAVVALHIQRGGNTYICTGTLISPEWVLTAAHCTDVQRGGKRNFIEASPSQVTVFIGDNDYGSGRSVADVIIYPGYDRKDFGVGDLSLVQLQNRVSGATTMPWLPASMASAEVLGTSINMAGFGVTCPTCSGTGIKMQVDGVLAGVTTTELENDQTGPPVSGTCGGDSGGPLIYDFGGTWYVGGVTSWGDGPCTDYGFSMRVSYFAPWIEGFVGSGCTSDCSDGDPCTDDVCDAGTCRNPTLTCDDGNVCTTDSCDPGSGCVFDDNALDCDDGDACTGPDACSGGDCQGNPINTTECTCGGNRASCSTGSDCCSGNCRGGSCRGN